MIRCNILVQAANCDIFEQWVNDVVFKWVNDEEDFLREYNCRRDCTNMAPTFTLRDLFTSYREFAEQSNALRLVENVTFRAFTAKFSLCEYRKSFDHKPNGTHFPRHKINNTQLQCRRWEMQQLAQKFGVEMNTPFAPVAHAVKRKSEFEDDKTSARRKIANDLLRQNTEKMNELVPKK